MKKIHHKLSLLFVLYFCQGLPGGFLSEALPVILRQQGLSLTQIGFAAFLSLPWVLKIFWAPLIDKFHIKSIGKRKSWIIPAHIGIIVICILLSIFSPDQDLFYIAILFLILNFFAATQDIGVDGFAVDILEKKEMGPGNTAQISGFKMGNLVGGGILLSLSAYLGWSGNFFIMAALIALAMTFLLFSSEEDLNSKREAEVDLSQSKSVVKKLWLALKSEGLPFWLFLIYVRFAEVFGVAMLKPMLTDKKYTLAQIGLLDGTIGAASVILGGVAGGLICRKKGWHFGLLFFTPLQGLSLFLFGLYFTGDVTMTGTGFLVAFEKFCGGAVGVSIFSLAMSKCTKEVGASQFTASQVIYMFGGYIAYPLSGFFADQFHYLPVMTACFVFTLLVIPMVLKIYKKENNKPQTSSV